MDRKTLIKSKEDVEEVHRKVYDGPSAAMHTVMATLKRPIESACAVNTSNDEFNLKLDRIG